MSSTEKPEQGSDTTRSSTPPSPTPALHPVLSGVTYKGKVMWEPGMSVEEECRRIQESLDSEE